jgi:uncharacterized membrane protein YgcG
MVRVPEDRDQAGVVEIRSNFRMVAKGIAAASASSALAAQHGNPGRDPLRPWGHPPLGLYRYLAQGPVPAGCDIEYGRQALVFQPETGKALEAEAFGRLLLMVYAGPAGKAGRLRPTQGGLRLEQSTFDALLEALAPDPQAVLSIEALPPPAWWQFWRRAAPTQPVAADVPRLSAPPLDETNVAALIAQGKRLSRNSRPQSDDTTDSSSGSSRQSDSTSNDTGGYSGAGGSFGGAGASGSWDAAAGGRRGVDSTGRITTAAAGAALAAGALDAVESGASSQASDDGRGGDSGTQTSTSY